MVSFRRLLVRALILLSDRNLARAIAVAALAGLALGCSEPHFTEAPRRDGAVTASPSDPTADGATRPAEQVGTLDASSARPPSERRDAETTVQPPQLAAGNANDGAAPSAPPDASAPSNAASTMPPWAEPLLGQYATRSVTFQRFIYLEIPVMTVQEEISVVRIERDGQGGAQSHTKLCSRVGESSEDIERYVDPRGLPEITRQLLFSADSWAEDAEPYGLGYDRDIPSDCERMENMAIARRPHQVWISGTQCRCPVSREIPPTVDDCRVLDPDGDRRPGMTLVDEGKQTLIGRLIASTVFAGIVSRDHHVDGRVAADGSHFARRMQDSVLYQLACIEGSVEQCPKYGDSTRPCTSAHNFTNFRRLEEGEPSDCESVLAQRAKLFPEPLPKPLPSCALQVLTDEPSRK